MNTDLPFFTDSRLSGSPPLNDLGQHIGKGDTDASLTVFAQRKGHNRRHRFGEAAPFRSFTAPCRCMISSKRSFTVRGKVSAR